MTERQEAQALSYAEASNALQQSLEIDALGERHSEDRLATGWLVHVLPVRPGKKTAVPPRARVLSSSPAVYTCTVLRVPPASTVRSNRLLTARLEALEEQIMAVVRDDSLLDLVQSLASAKVELADAQWRLLQQEVSGMAGLDACLAMGGKERWGDGDLTAHASSHPYPGLVFPTRETIGQLPCHRAS